MVGIKTVLKRSPRLMQGRSLLQLVSSYASDILRYAGHSGAIRTRRVAVLEAHIVMDFHRIEKGLTLAAPRPWFGRDTVERLIRNCSTYQQSEAHDPMTLSAAVGALEEYQSMFAKYRCDWWEGNSNTLQQLANLVDRETGHLGGTEEYLLPDSDGETAWSFSDLATSRSSVRNFDENAVLDATIQSAMTVAQFTPSVCNRQSTRVRIYPRGPSATAVLKLQNGNRGFGADASHVLLITSDLTAFLSPGERNQAYIDGGMYAMSIVYALQDLGVSSCCLNWSTVRRQDRRLRVALELPPEEVVIMMIAIGYAKPAACVTRSPHRANDRVNLSPGYGH